MSTEPSIFTRIINREIPATIVYEDEHTIAFLTIGPVTKGHTLVVPKKPFVNIFDSDITIFNHMIITTKKVASALVKAGLGEGVNIHMNNGEAAGQEVFHAHIHVIPRRLNDNAVKIPHAVEYEEKEATNIGNLITAQLS